MEIIQVQVPLELAQRLRPHYEELPQILEWGLRQLEQNQTEAERQQQLIAILRQVGVTGPDPGTVAQYLAEQAAAPWTPLEAGGKPASEIIIEDRASRL
jgi:hypothetical protein